MKRFLKFFVGLWLVGTLMACNSNNASTEPSAESTIEDTAATSPPVGAREVIVFFGNSLTAGYGLNPSEAFPALLQQRIDSLQLPYTVINAGVSGETTATGKNRVAWVVKRQPVSVFVLELGGNDGLRGISPSETRQNLSAIIDTVRAVHPQARIVLAGMMVPPNMGAEYSHAFRKIFPEVAAAKKVSLIPFLLENVGGVDSLNQPDGIHPTARGHQLVAENVWPILFPLLNDRSGQ